MKIALPLASTIAAFALGAACSDALAQNPSLYHLDCRSARAPKPFDELIVHGNPPDPEFVVYALPRAGEKREFVPFGVGKLTRSRRRSVIAGMLGARLGALAGSFSMQLAFGTEDSGKRPAQVGARVTSSSGFKDVPYICRASYAEALGPGESPPPSPEPIYRCDESEDGWGWRACGIEEYCQQHACPN